MAILADFHNHSCLSPCGSLDLSPRVLVSRAATKGIGLLALTDHNSTKNGPAFQRACQREGILPLFGMEATTAEEIHVLCLFGSLDEATAFDQEWTTHRPFIPNNPALMGDQVWVDDDENIEGEVEGYLGVASELGIDHIGPLVERFGGLTIPAHIDRPSFSMTSQLGFIVRGPWAALECIRVPPQVDTLGYPLTTSSDAHYVEHVGRRAFTLDAERDELLSRDGRLSMEALATALRRRRLLKA